MSGKLNLKHYMSEKIENPSKLITMKDIKNPVKLLLINIYLVVRDQL